jgi:hypothetical protein
MKDCEYCGSMLTDDGANATDGTHHFAAQCREYVHAALRSYKRDLAAERAKSKALEARELDADESAVSALYAKSLAVMALEDERAKAAEERRLSDALVRACEQLLGPEAWTKKAPAIISAIEWIKAARARAKGE